MKKAIITILAITISLLSYSQLSYTQQNDFNKKSILKMNIDCDTSPTKSVVLLENNEEIKFNLIQNKKPSLKVGATVLYLLSTTLITYAHFETMSPNASSHVAYGGIIGLMTGAYIIVLCLE